MKTVLITGGAGFIGSHTCIWLLKKGYKIIVADSNINSSPIAIHRIKSICKSTENKSSNLIFEKGDIRDESFLKNIFLRAIKRDSPIESVIHFAGLKAVEESIKYPLEYWDVNVVGSLSLFKIMNSFECRTIVFSSSATVYGNPVKNPINEDSMINPANPYGYTKAAIENILYNLSKKDSLWRIANLRYFNPIGAHKSGLVGESPTGKPNNLFPYICKVAIGEYKKLSIFGNNWPTKDGTCVRDYIHVMDIAEAHLLALEFLITKKPQIINLNVGTGIGTSVLELIRIFEKVNKCYIPYEFARRRLGDVAEIIADNRKIMNILNWKPTKGIEDMCQDSWRWHLLNPKGF